MTKNLTLTNASYRQIPTPTSVAVVGKHSALVKKLCRKLGFKIEQKHPEMVVTFGGDGTILHSERLYPGVPKLCARFSQHCLKCGVGTYFHSKLHHGEHVSLLHSSAALEAALKKISSRKSVRVKLEEKLQATVKRKGKEIFHATALNEVQVHNKNPLHAIRGVACVGSNCQTFIGDGVIVATPFGSTGYFYSVTQKSFKKGVGMAFNNPTTKTPPVIGELEGKGVRIFIERRNGLLICDNDPKMFLLAARDEIVVKKSKQNAWFVHSSKTTRMI